MKRILVLSTVFFFINLALKAQSPAEISDPAPVPSSPSGMTYKVDGGGRQVAVPKRVPGRTGSVAAVPVAFINVSQHSAYVKRPTVGPGGYQLYFVESMAIGGKQATEIVDGIPRHGIYIIADLLKQGEVAHTGDIGKSFAKEKIFCMSIFPNGNEFRYPENGGPYKIAN